MRAVTFTPSDDLNTQFDLLIERVKLFHLLGERTSQSQDLETLQELAYRLSDPQRTARVEVMNAYYHYYAVSDYHAVIQRSERVLNLLDEDRSIEIVLDAYLLLSSAHWQLGNLEEAMQVGGTCLQLARDAGERLQEGRMLSVMGLVALEQNKHDFARECLTEAVLIARAVRNTDLEGKALNNLGMTTLHSSVFALSRLLWQAYAIMHERGAVRRKV
jgi:tetratricopeptide (TPR) repeat protein